MNGLTSHLIVYLLGFATPIFLLQRIGVDESDQAGGCFINLVLGAIGVVIVALLYVEMVAAK